MRTIFFLLLVGGVALVGCRKAFLAQKPSTNLLVPNSLTVIQQLLDNQNVMNLTPALGEVSGDNIWFSDLEQTKLSAKEFNAYIWASDIYEGQGLVSDWDNPYSEVFYANTVLQGLAAITPDSTDQTEWNTLKGWALFCRGYAFFNIAELFAKPYDSATAASDPGIPIRLSPDINVKTTRSTMQASYTQILNDLNAAEILLPAAIPANNLNRPSRLAVQALLARIYLSVRDYKDAKLYADSVLKGHPDLLDFNSVAQDTLSTVLVPFHNTTMPEVIYQSNMPPASTATTVLEALVCTGCFVDTSLMASYASNDLRRAIFYRSVGVDTFSLKGTYAGSVFLFSGLATDELYLIRAECGAREGDTAAARSDLNKLLMDRYRTGTFAGYSFGSAAEALDSILVERRKELAFRGIRWSDLRRFNQEGRAVMLYRTVNGHTYSLPPGSDLYTLPIPPDVLNLSGIQQNPR